MLVSTEVHGVAVFAAFTVVVLFLLLVVVIVFAVVVNFVYNDS